MFSSAREKLIYAFYFGIILIAIGLPLSKFLISVGQFFILGYWLLSGSIFDKCKKFFKNKIAVAVSLIFLLHLFGLLYTSDFNYAAKDLRIKIPLLLLPLVFSTSPRLSQKWITSILVLFCLAVFIQTLISFYKINFTSIVDIRNASGSLSHIRLSLMICLSVCFLLQKIRTNPLLISLPLIWFLYFLILLQSLTGILIFAILLLIFFNYLAWTSKNKKVIFGIVLLNIILVVIPYLIVKDELNKFYTPVKLPIYSELEKQTTNGAYYFHDTSNTDCENGFLVGTYICWDEMKNEWNRKSKIKFGEKDNKGNEIQFTILRYLTSMGVRKDSVGISQLTKADIEHIENGISNINYANMANIRTRIHDIIYEIDQYKNRKDPSGHSLVQRLEFWRAATGIISKNIFFGVGTGDLPSAFENEYATNKTTLKTEFRLRAHNQFLTMAVAFGVLGLLVFIFSVYYPLMFSNIRSNFLYLAFILIFSVSMLNEDTLETQVGVTFFAFFNCLLLFAEKEK